jgi:Calcineurin-like phosphoesterase
MLSLVGDDPAATPLAELFLPRLGDWVDGHTSTFLGQRSGALAALGDEERSELTLPSELPSPPPFEPLPKAELEVPGERIFRFGILADLHFGSTHGETMARAAIADLNKAGVDLVIQLGDITDHGERDEFEVATRALAELQMPVTTMMGNHDVYSLKEERISGREYYSSAFDRDPDGVIIEHKGWRFAVLDSIEHAASPFAPFDLVTGSFVEGSGGAVVRGSLSVPQHELLAEIAEPGAPPAFVFLHHPPQPFTGFPPVLFGLREADSGRLHATVESGNVWGVFAGHTHRNSRTRDYGTVPAHEVAIPRDYPFGYGLVDVGTRGYAYRFVQLSDEALLREASMRSGTIHRRYGRGRDEELAFTWTAPEDNASG